MPAVGTDNGSGRVEADERRRLLAWAGTRGVDRREAGWILEHVDTEPGAAPTPVARDGHFRVLIERRAAGEPLQYVLGRWAFRSLELDVDRRVLIPRPETEQVVEVALGELGSTLAGPGRPTGESVQCIDLGTGSGAVALALATEAGPRWPGLEVWASDESAGALEVAAANLDRLSDQVAAAGARVHLALGWWFAAQPGTLAGRADLIVANPPYVSESELAGLDPGVRDWEPEGALVAPSGTAGVGGMADVEAIVAGAPRWLRPGGRLVVEIAPHQADAALDAARRAGLTRIRTERDLAGRLRMLVAGR